jgi:hypothetical protein
MCQFHKHFTLVTFSNNKMSCCILKTLHMSVLTINGLTYFATAVGYKCKMFMKFVSIS